MGPERTRSSVVTPSSGLFRVSAPDRVLSEALDALGLPCRVGMIHDFSPFGRSWLCVGQKRHPALHTWLEHALVTVDLLAPEAVDLDVLLAPLGWSPVAQR